MQRSDVHPTRCRRDAPADHRTPRSPACSSADHPLPSWDARPARLRRLREHWSYPRPLLYGPPAHDMSLRPDTVRRLAYGCRPCSFPPSPLSYHHPCPSGCTRRRVRRRLRRHRAAFRGSSACVRLRRCGSTSPPALCNHNTMNARGWAASVCERLRERDERVGRRGGSAPR